MGSANKIQFWLQNPLNGFSKQNSALVAEPNTAPNCVPPVENTDIETVNTLLQSSRFQRLKTIHSSVKINRNQFIDSFS